MSDDLDYGRAYRGAAEHMGRMPKDGSITNLPNPLNPLNYQRTESEIRMEAKLDEILRLLKK